MDARRQSLPSLALEALALAAFFGLAAVYVSRVIWDIDVFWHIAAGRAFVDAGEIVRTDFFSAIDPQRTWVSFEWAYEVLVYLLDQAGGLQLVRAAHAAVMLGALLLFWWGCRRRLALGPLLSFVLVALLLVLFEDRIRVRPHVVNLLGWCLLFPWLVRGPRSLGPLATIGTAVIVGVWANLHAGGAFLFLVAAATLPVGAVAQRVLGAMGPEHPHAVRRSVVWYLGALVPALASPNFVRGNYQALSMLDATEHAIPEWHPTWTYFDIASTAGHYVCGIVPLAVAALWLVVAAGQVRSVLSGLGPFRRALERTPAWATLLCLALVVLSLRSIRFAHIAVFALVVLGPHVRHVFAGWTLPRPAARALLALAAALLVAVGYDFNVSAQGGSLEATVAAAFGDRAMDERRFPIEQADFLAATGFEGGVYCQPNWGGYLLYRLWPRVKVVADGRGNYDRSVRDGLDYLYDRAHHQDPANGPRVQAIYESVPVDALVHQHPAWPARFRPDPARWIPVFSNAKGAIWVRATPRGRAYVEHLAELRRSGELGVTGPPPRP